MRFWLRFFDALSSGDKRAVKAFKLWLLAIFILAIAVILISPSR